MNTLVSKTWNRTNRSEIVGSILKDLKSSGAAYVEYFKGRSHVISYYLRKRKLEPVNEDDEWNYARITYQEKVALEFLELRVHLSNSTPFFEGRFFDERFTVRENECILDALNGAGISTYRADMSGKTKLFFSLLTPFLAFYTLYFLSRGLYGISALTLFCSLISAWLLFMK